MINPNKQEAADLAHIAEHVKEWPKGADFIYLGPGDVIHIIEGGDSAVCKYINREQWAAARTLLGYWFPGKDVWPDTSCPVCGEEHCQYEAFPGICGEYDSGTVTLELARAINGVCGDAPPVGLASKIPDCTVTPEEEETQPKQTGPEKYAKYRKDVRHLDSIDVYETHRLYAIDDPSGCIQHASKKLLLSGVRTGGKSKQQDIEEARDTLNRWLEMNGAE
jgi:hypothetical protein